MSIARVICFAPNQPAFNQVDAKKLHVASARAEPVLGEEVTKNAMQILTWLLEDRNLVVLAREERGPPVEPARSGFGRILLERLLRADLKREVSLRFARSGVNCRIALPGSRHLVAL
jgi:hypothetical protein